MEERQGSSEKGSPPTIPPSTPNADSHQRHKRMSSSDQVTFPLSQDLIGSTTPPEPESPKLLAHRVLFQSMKQPNEEISLHEPPPLSIGSPQAKSSLPAKRPASSTSSIRPESDAGFATDASAFAKPIAPRSATDQSQKSQVGHSTPPITAADPVVHIVPREPLAGQIHARDDLSSSGSQFSGSDASSLLDTPNNSGSSVAAHYAAQMRRRYPSIQFRSSTEAAMQCPRIIRNKPRMRKRRKKLTAEDEFKTTDSYDDSKREQSGIVSRPS